MSTKLWWYVARASGLTAWALLAASVLWGLLLSTRTLGSKPKPAWLSDLHRFLGALAVVFTLVHMLALVADSYAHFGLAELLIPLASKWHPGPVAWGITALYGLVAVEATSVLKRHLSNRLWRAVHLSSLPLYLVATLHLLTAGTDTGHPWVRLAVLGVTLLTLFLVLVRILAPRRAPRTRSRSRTTAVAARTNSVPQGGNDHEEGNSDHRRRGGLARDRLGRPGDGLLRGPHRPQRGEGNDPVCEERTGDRPEGEPVGDPVTAGHS